MAPTATDVAIPASVTLDGQVVYDLLIEFMLAEQELHDEMIAMPNSFSDAFCDLYKAAFGCMYRDCDKGLPDGCKLGEACAACNGSIGKCSSVSPASR